MKSKRLRRLQTWMIVVLFLYVLMLGYSSLVVPFQNGILFAVTGRQGQATTERRIESDQTVQELQDDIHVSTQNFSHALRVQRDLLHIYFYANVAVIGFLGWSTFTIFRIKREVDHDA